MKLTARLNRSVRSLRNERQRLLLQRFLMGDGVPASLDWVTIIHDALLAPQPRLALAVLFVMSAELLAHGRQTRLPKSASPWELKRSKRAALTDLLADIVVLQCVEVPILWGLQPVVLWHS